MKKFLNFKMIHLRIATAKNFTFTSYLSQLCLENKCNVNKQIFNHSIFKTKKIILKSCTSSFCHIAIDQRQCSSCKPLYFKHGTANLMLIIRFLITLNSV